MMWLLSAVLLLLFYAPDQGSASPGSLVIHNHCNFEIFYVVTLAENFPKPPLYPGQVASVPFQNKEDGSGMSVKMTKTEDDLTPAVNELQFETTLAADRVYYDLSRVNDKHGEWVPYSYFAVVTNHPNCRRLTCLAGDYRCLDEYVLPPDDYATTACDSDAIIHLHLCANPSSVSSSLSTSLATGFPTGFSTSFYTSFSPSSPSSCSSFNR